LSGKKVLGPKTKQIARKEAENAIKSRNSSNIR